jgi:adenylate cyclase
MAFVGGIASRRAGWDSLEKRRRARLAQAFAREERRGRRLATGLRLAAVVAIVVWVLYQNPSRSAAYHVGLAFGFAALGYAQLWLSEHGRLNVVTSILFVALDAALLAYTLSVPNPLNPEPVPPGLPLRLHNFVYFFLLLALNALCFTRGLVLLTGCAGALAWAGAVGWVLHVTGRASPDTLASAWQTSTGLIVRLGDPNYVMIFAHATEIVVLLLVAGVLEAVVARARTLVAAQAESERARGNLARYFSPNVVDELTRMERPLGPGRVQPAAVLFADLVGFTALSERLAPDQTIALLREAHHRMAEAVFAHDGTLDKYIGDAVMATFGAPRPGPDDAARALACARELVTQLDELNLQRLARGEVPLAVGIGLHYGDVITGDVGDERRLEFTVIGDTVNVASRIERLTRDLGLTILASDEVIRSAGGPPAGYRELGEHALPGRAAPVRLWGWSRTGDVAQTAPGTEDRSVTFRPS